MNDELRLPVMALCVAGVAGLIWIAMRDSDLGAIAAFVAVVAGICGFAGIAAAMVKPKG